MHRLGRANGTALTTAAAVLIGTDELRPAARGSLAALLESFSRWRAMAGDMAPAELAKTVIDESGYAEMWQKDKSPDAPGRLDNLKELALALEEFETLGAFLEHVSLVMEQENRVGEAMVSVMTLHGAKGLEFEVVFLPGWEEGLFPNQRTMDESGAAGLEEERRLAYVGLTRAKRRAYVSFAANRRIFNQWVSAIPSRFIDELPPETVEVVSAPGLYGNASDASGWGGGHPGRERYSSARYSRAGLAEGGDYGGGGKGRRLRPMPAPRRIFAMRAAGAGLAAGRAPGIRRSRSRRRCAPGAPPATPPPRLSGAHLPRHSRARGNPWHRPTRRAASRAASACSTRSSATARWWRWTAPSSRSRSTRPATRR